MQYLSLLTVLSFLLVFPELAFSQSKHASRRVYPTELTQNGRFVESINDAIVASITVNVKDGHGSGFFISDSIVVTNNHVVENQRNITTTLDKRIGTLVVIAFDTLYDLAILKADFASEVYYKLPEDSALAVSVGDEILIIGSPTSKLLVNSLSSGIISGIRKLEEVDIIQTDAKINPGNSGGALIDPEGNLQGVVTAKVSGFGIEGLGFAIPAKYILELLKKNSIE